MKHIDEYLDDVADDITTETAYVPGKVVPNQFPRIKPPQYRIAIIGEAPGRDEELEGKPFIGMSGRLLTALLSKANIVRDTCFIGNVCQVRPPANDITKFSIDGPEITAGLRQLEQDIIMYRPHLCILLGKTALWAATGETAIGNWRGSVIYGNRNGFEGVKCIATYHPAAIFRQYEFKPIAQFDIIKATKYANDQPFVKPLRNLEVNLTFEETVQRMDEVLLRKPKIAIDIEGYVDAMSCISIATAPNQSFIVPFMWAGRSVWEEHQEAVLWQKLSHILSDPTIPKVLQNSLYDRFVLQYSYDIVVRGVVDDTMLKHWELYCELEKSLSFQCSLYTEEPYYKSDRKADDRDTFWEYCCRDSAVTLEISNQLDRYLKPAQRKHYQFNLTLLNPLLYMENLGIRYDTRLATKRLEIVMQQVYELQADLDAVAGYGIKSPITREELLRVLQDSLCYKRNRTQPKKGNENEYAFLSGALFSNEPLTKAFIGRFNAACGIGLNIKSPEFKKYLYGTLKLPLQTNIEGRASANYEALLNLTKKSPHPALRIALDLGLLRTRAQMLAIHADPDGRIRCGYNIVGTETGRITCYTSPTGSGYNLQTIPSEDKLKPEGHPLRNGMRDLFVADDGYWLFQCDLSGADGWTVAAHLAALGDPTMLLDYKFGIKPAKVLCYLLRHGASSLNGRSREEILHLTAEVKSSDWDYFACKIGQHGTCYLMGVVKLSIVIFIQSEGKVSLSSRETADIQRLFSIRYRVKLWHDATQRVLAKSPVIVAASGHTRRFYGRAKEILGQALAHEPQANTTYATNLAMYRLWTDPENRLENLTCGNNNHLGRDSEVSNGRPPIPRLRIQPLHQVHDAIVGQFPKADTTWAIGKIKSYFDNELVIAGQRIVIPFEGHYGESWGNLKAGAI